MQKVVSSGVRRLGWPASSLAFKLSLAGLIICSSSLGLAAPTSDAGPLALTPPMGWNDWAHYRCKDLTSRIILANALFLAHSGLAEAGYNTVVIDDCWMQKDRDANGNLQPDLKRFPKGIKPVADAVHALNLKFGLYEDAGYKTCAGFAGSGEPQGGGESHFLQDAKLFESWGVDYLKLDACNLFVPKGSSKATAFQKAYAAESAALKKVGRPVVFSESAPAPVQGTPDWYKVLGWVGRYGQLWREGSDIIPHVPGYEHIPSFDSVLWNYTYNLPLGRFQKPGNWNDPDFIIGGDDGMSLAETRSQFALWSMMSAPLMLSSDLTKLTPSALAVLNNKAVIAIDQDPGGRMATLIRRTPVMDVLFKALEDGDYAVAALNRNSEPEQVVIVPNDLGFPERKGCYLNLENLWTGDRDGAATSIRATVAPHDTQIWRVRPGSICGTPTRTGAIVVTNNGDPDSKAVRDSYSECLTDSGAIRLCLGTYSELWTFLSFGSFGDGTKGQLVQRARYRSLSRGVLMSHGQCLGVVDGQPSMQKCSQSGAVRWTYSTNGNLISLGNRCLTAEKSDGKVLHVSLLPCGYNRSDQLWSLPEY